MLPCSRGPALDTTCTQSHVIMLRLRHPMLNSPNGGRFTKEAVVLQHTSSTLPAWQRWQGTHDPHDSSCQEPCSHATRPSSKVQRPIVVRNAGSSLAPERLLHQPLTGGTCQPHTQWQGRLVELQWGRGGWRKPLSPNLTFSFAAKIPLFTPSLSCLLGLSKYEAAVSLCVTSQRH